MSNNNVNVNDTVRIGGGKVEYRVDSVENGKAFVVGEKSSRSVDVEKLVVVKSFEPDALSIPSVESQSFDPEKYTVVVEGEVAVVKRGLGGALDAMIKLKGKREVWHRGRVVVQRAA